MEELLAYLEFNTEQIICLSVLSFITVIQLYYYLFYYRKPLSSYKKKLKGEIGSIVGANQPPSVSVIILSRNESENLKKNLPYILNQDYSDFEVIVVNDGSTDESHELLESLSLEYPQLYHTFIQEPSDKALPRKMLSMTIGIKAAKNEMLLFTDPDCKPTSNKWIASMMENVHPSTNAVIGYSSFERKAGFYRRMARFDNLLFSLRFLSKAICKKGYIGVLQNFAFRRSLFFETNGLSSCLNYGEGEIIYLNKIITKSEYQIALDPDSFVSLPLNQFSRWSELKRAYFGAKKFFKRGRYAFKLETISRYLFYILSIAFLTLGIYLQEWGVVAVAGLCFLIREIVQFIILKKAASHFKTKRFLFSLILLDLLQPIYNNYFYLTSRPRKR